MALAVLSQILHDRRGHLGALFEPYGYFQEIRDWGITKGIKNGLARKKGRKKECNFGPRLYPMGSMVIALVSPSVRPLVRPSVRL